MTYIILYESDLHATFDSLEEARDYYNDLVEEDGKHFDITLCEVVSRHEATEEFPSEPIDYSHLAKVQGETKERFHKNWKSAMRSIFNINKK